MTHDPPKIRSEVARRMALDQIRYSMVWEDFELLRTGLQIGDSDDVLSIVSAGDNALAMLLDEPRSLTAIDMSPAQIALFELKLAGIRHLEHEDFVALMGFAPGRDRAKIYTGIRRELPAEAGAFWDRQGETILAGIADAGRLGRYFARFRTEHLPQLWPEGLAAQLFESATLSEQAELFTTRAATADFEVRFRWYFGRDMMAKHGRDPAQFHYVRDGDVGNYFYGRFCYACTQLPMRGNFYLERFLTGGYSDLEAGPLYVRRTEFARLKTLVDRVSVVTAELEEHLAEVAPRTYSKAQLSDVFEYMSDEAAETLFSLLGRALRPGGRVAYWNLLVPRQPGEASGLRALQRESEELWKRDRSWFYRAFRLDEVEG